MSGDDHDGKQSVVLINPDGVVGSYEVPTFAMQDYQHEITQMFDDWARVTRAAPDARDVLVMVGETMISYQEIQRRLTDLGYHVVVMGPRQQGKTARIHHAYIEPDDITALNLIHAPDVKEEPLRRQPDYLKHDPSKSHRRHGRKRRHERPFS